MKALSFRGAVFFLFTMLVCAPAVWAQEIYATLTGTVKDVTGAVVPNASITVHNDETNTDLRTVKSDASGTYTATNLPAGNYTITVKAPGFETFTASNVVLYVAEKRTLNIQLQVGAVAQNVTVTESAVPVQTASAAESTTITGTQVRELELNNRNFEQLVTLQPGVTSALPAIINFGISNTDSVVVNGARTGANNWTVDGADINDSGSNLTLLNVPSVDAIQEFTTERSTYDAQYGRSGGGQVLVATKSGTSQFHGDLYEFDRNTVFNANDFFSNSAGRARPAFHYNDFGFTIGGPIFIPRLYPKRESKTFFFVSEEWRKSGQPSTPIATVPTAAELNGTFKGNLTSAAAPAGCVTYNSGTNTSQINPACISQNAKAYIENVYSKFPGNAANGTEYITNVIAKQNFREDLVRLDQNITDKLHVFGRFMQDVVPTTEPGGLFASEALPGISSTATNAPGRNVVANVTWSITPTVVNEAAFNYSWGAINSNITGIINSPSFLGALSGGLPYSDPYGRIPGVSINGFTGVSIPVAPYFERNIDKNVYDNFSKIIGNHTIRTGFTAQWMTKTENAVNPTNGSFSFTNINGIVGSSFANFLLGDANTFSQSSRDMIPHLNYTNFEAYLQDDWKVSQRLTLNLGVRYSYFPTPTDSNKILNNFDPLLYNPANAALINPVNGNFVAGQGVTPATYVNGIIFADNACPAAKQIVSTVACSPFGNEVNPSPTDNFAPRIGFAFDPEGNGKMSIRAGYGMFYDRTLNGMWEQNAFSIPPLVQSTTITYTTFDSFDHPLAGTTSVPLGPSHFDTSGDPGWKTPYYQDWNFSIERQVSTNTVFEIAYVGTKGTDLLGEIDSNQPTLAERQANPTVNVNAIRPYVGYSYMKDRVPRFDSNYNSLQISLNRRVANGLTFGLAYTWSKNLSDNPADRDAPIYDTYNFRLSYGPAAFNTPQIFVANYVYDLPFFRSQHGVIGHVLGGWELSGITRIQSGQSLTVTQSSDPFNSADWPAGTPGVYPGGIGIDPSPISPRADLVPGVSVNGPGTVNEFFNTAAFTNAIGHFGTEGRGVFLGPGLDNWDMAAMKNIQFGERVRFQLRGEFFNAFNHVNFTSVSTNVNSSTFGRLTADYEPRIIQVGAKLNF
jgi:hypothetical protein